MYISTYITCGSKKEAEKIAEALVTEKLAACVNYFPINSVYIWKDKLEKDFRVRSTFANFSGR